jgi:hypothetical protein
MSDTAAMNADPAVRPFHVDIAEEAIIDLRRRIAAHRLIAGGVGHNLPQEAPLAFAEAVIEADGY